MEGLNARHSQLYRFWGGWLVLAATVHQDGPAEWHAWVSTRFVIYGRNEGDYRSLGQARDLRMRYLGALGLLAECSVQLGLRPCW